MTLLLSTCRFGLLATAEPPYNPPRIQLARFLVKDDVMTASAARTEDAFGPLARLRLGREIIESEGQALLALAAALADEFCQAADLLFACRGSVIVSGMGKAGLVGQKIAATLASTGTRSHFLHPGEAIHGDLGRIHQRRRGADALVQRRDRRNRAAVARR